MPIVLLVLDELMVWSRYSVNAMEAQKASTINAAIILDEVRVLSEEELRLLSRSVSKISPNHDYFSEDVILRSDLCVYFLTYPAAHLIPES